jgi:hypothetical protein
MRKFPACREAVDSAVSRPRRRRNARRCWRYATRVEAGPGDRGRQPEKANVKVACQPFRNYLATEAKFIKALETNGASCGAPPQVVQQVRGSHAKAQQLGKQVCDAAARGVTAGPTLSDALGTSPVLPDPSKKKGAGTFETLTGNPFARP